MRYRKFLSIIAVVSMLTILGSFAIALGAEEIIEGTVSAVTTGITKNGEAYTRVLTSFERELGGVKYSVILPVMGFGNQAEPAAQLEQSQPLKAIAQNRIFEGRESYTIIQLLE